MPLPIQHAPPSLPSLYGELRELDIAVRSLPPFVIKCVVATMTSQTASRDTSTIYCLLSAVKMGWLSALQQACALPLQCVRGGDVAVERTIQEAGSILSSLPGSVVKNAEVDLELKSGFAKAAFTGGATLLCVAGITYLWNTYGGSSLRRKHFNGKSKFQDTCLVQYEAGKAEDAEELLYDPEWCLPPGSLWCEVAGDAWSRGEGVSCDPHYGLPPWMEGDAGGEETEDESLSWEEDFNLQAGVLWADISPVEDLVLEAPYQLKEE